MKRFFSKIKLTNHSFLHSLISVKSLILLFRLSSHIFLVLVPALVKICFGYFIVSGIKVEITVNYYPANYIEYCESKRKRNGKKLSIKLVKNSSKAFLSCQGSDLTSIENKDDDDDKRK